MVYANTKSMLYALRPLNVPNDYEAKLIRDLWERGTLTPDQLSLAQYNKVVELFNKYVLLQTAHPRHKYDATNRK